MLFIHFASIAALAIAVSLDSFGVGITYGLRKITIPFLSIVIIACCSGGVIAISMQAGTWLTSFLPPIVASRIGAVILIAIGCWALYQFYRNLRGQKEVHTELVQDGDDHGQQAQLSNEHAKPEMINSTLFTIEFKRLGVVIQILRKPQTADFDDSGTISSSEALMLGIALSLDALGAGLGAAMLGLPAVYTPLIIACFSAMFLIVGTMLGRKLSHLPMVHYISGLPGLLLILLGVMKLF